MQLFQAVFKSLSVHEVRYLVVGGVAAIVHGVPRTTFSLDLLIEANEANARRPALVRPPSRHPKP